MLLSSLMTTTYTVLNQWLPYMHVSPGQEKCQLSLPASPLFLCQQIFSPLFESKTANMPPVTELTLDSADISSIPECDYKSVDTIALALSQLMSKSSPRVFLHNLSTLTAKNPHPDSEPDSEPFQEFCIVHLYGDKYGSRTTGVIAKADLQCLSQDGPLDTAVKVNL